MVFSKDLYCLVVCREPAVVPPAPSVGIHVLYFALSHKYICSASASLNIKSPTPERLIVPTVVYSHKLGIFYDSRGKGGGL